jgi:hypothetical protein
VNAKKRRALFERLSAAISERTTELNSPTPFEWPIAALATGKNANKATAYF